MANRNNIAEAAGFDVTTDLANVLPGATFEATWTFKNSGRTTWNGRYQFAYTEKAHAETANFPCSPLSKKKVWKISEIGASSDVKPGETVQLTLSMKAPTESGTHGTNWQLQSPDGTSFGPIRWLRPIIVTAVDPTQEKLAYQTLDFTNSVGNFNNMQPGQQFVGTWSLQNTGTKAWSGDFQVAYLDKSVDSTQQMSRDLMGASATMTLRDLTGRNQVNPSETVDIPLSLTAPLHRGVYAFHWELRDGSGNPFGGVRWLQVSVVRTVSIIDEEETRPFQPGMNLNPEIHGLDIDRLDGLSWVRFPFFASRISLTPEEAYQQRYRRIIQAYSAANIGALLVLHQDTEWGNAPWDGGDWTTYATLFAQACGRVAKACAEFGDKVAYQIFNEQDSPPSNPSAIHIDADKFAIVLDKAVAAIRAVQPNATIVMGGLNTGPDNAVNYVKKVQRTLNGRLPVDALAYHPYGRYVNIKVFNTFGPLSEVLDKFQASFPDKPMWITEFGLPGHAHKIGSEHYANIAQHLREMAIETSTTYAGYVQALIWFAWTDQMENAGILTSREAGTEKEHIWDAFLEMKSLGQAGPEFAAMAFGEKTDKVTFLSYTSTLANINAVPAGTKFINTWRFKNSGTTTWNADYQLAYISKGTHPAVMSAQKSYSLAEVSDSAQIEPGDILEIRLDMVAPKQSGRTYHSQWELRSPDGDMFAFVYEDVTVLPASTVGTSVRTSNMTFIKDKETFPDGTRLVAGTDFNKQWQVKNTGKRQWGSGFRLVHLDGDRQMGRNKVSILVPSAKPGEIVTLTIPMTAPPAFNSTKEYKSSWRLQDDRGNMFGQILWTTIVSTTAVSDSGSSGSIGSVTQGTALSRLVNNPAIWYSQKDSKWGKIQLGFGSQTIEKWGCLMTCMSMALTAYGTAVTPPQMNSQSKSRGGFFDNSSAIRFYAPGIIGGLKFRNNVASWAKHADENAIWTGEDPIQRIDNALAKGEIVVAQVDWQRNNVGFDQHWVVIVKRTPNGKDYMIIDPYMASTEPKMISLMDKYGNYVASQSNEVNLRNAIRSTLVYHKPTGSGS